MRCKNCGNDVKSDFKYCPFCASRLMQDFNEHFSDLEPPVLQSEPAKKNAEDVIYGEVQDISAMKNGTHKDKPVFTESKQDQDFLLDTPSEHLPDPTPIAQTPPTSKEPVARVRERQRKSPGYIVYRPSAGSAVPELPTIQKTVWQKPTPPPREAVPPPPPIPSYTPPPPPAPDNPHEVLDWEDFDEVEEVEELISFGVPDRLGDFSDLPGRPAPAPRLEMDAARSESAPYVSMKPEVDAKVQSPEPLEGPGAVFKLLLLVFIILVGILTSVAVYWVVVTSDWFNMASEDPLAAQSSVVETLENSADV